MERKIKKEISLKTIFFRFLVQIILSWALILVLFISIMELLIIFNVILPADAIEMNISSWQETLTSDDSFTPDTLPTGTDYACFSMDGELLFTNMQQEALDTATSLIPASSETTANGSDVLINQSIYKLIYGRHQLLVLSYQLNAAFTSPLLQRIFPSAEPFLLLLLLFLVLADLIFFILHYAKKLEGELLLLQYASEQIYLRNLDFECRRTGICEFNRVLRSLLLLRDELRHSLKGQWQLQQQKKEQLSALAHDIKTPLTIIRGNAELLAESTLTDEQREYNSFIMENTRQIHDYVAQMLEISKEQLPSSSDCDLDELLSVLQKTAKNLSYEKKLIFSLHKENLPENLHLPEDSLKRILTNIIDNAVQYSPMGGTITMTAARIQISSSASMLVFTVTDNGCGFSKEALLLGTTEFYRADSSRSSKEHFGMGLAIANHLTQSLHGSLLLSNHAAGGACVTVQIPIP